jgi:hypothetical protein
MNITKDIEQKAGISSRDLKGLEESSFLSFPLMSLFVRSKRWLNEEKCVLRDANEPLTPTTRRREWIFNIMYEKDDTLLDYTALLILNKSLPSSSLWSPSYFLYMPPLESEEMFTRVIEKADKIATASDTRIFYRKEVANGLIDTKPSTTKSFLASIQILYLLYSSSKYINENTQVYDLFDELLDTHLIIYQQGYKDERMPFYWDAMQNDVIRFAHETILKAYFKEVVMVDDDDDDDDDDGDDDETKKRTNNNNKVIELGINSSLIDLAILRMQSQYLTSNIIHDMLLMISKEEENCLTIDPLY